MRDVSTEALVSHYRELEADVKALIADAHPFAKVNHNAEVDKLSVLQCRIWIELRRRGHFTL